MENLRIGKIEVVTGEKGGRFPFSNTLFIDDQVKVVIDPGAGLSRLRAVKEKADIDLIINTHYHLDHIGFNYIFPGARIYCNEIESGCYGNPREIARRYGFVEVFGEDWLDGWLERISRPDTPPSRYSLQNRYEWTLSTARLDGVFSWGETLDFGCTRMEVIGTPGHTAGFCCLYFPDHGVLYTGDIDLTGFGPWYAKDGDIDLFINSARAVASRSADLYITGHEIGAVSRSEFIARLDVYLEVINDRDRKIMAALTRPLTLEELSDRGLIYDRRFHVDAWIRCFELMMIEKHLQRLLQRRMIGFHRGRYYR